MLKTNPSTLITCQTHTHVTKLLPNYTTLFFSNPMTTFLPQLRLKNQPFRNTHLLRALPGKNNEQKWVYEGLITESLPDLLFRVRLDGADNNILGYLCGKMKLNHIKLLVGDKVKVELSRYDSTRGRIVFRQDSRERTDKTPKKVKKKGSQNNNKKK